MSPVTRYVGLVCATAGLVAGFVPGAIAADPPPAAAATNRTVVEDVNDLVTRINQKLAQGKTNETDLAENVREFDALLAKHKDDPPQQRVRVLLIKAQLYDQVFDQPDKVLDVLRQVKRDFPGLQVNGSTDETIKALEARVEKHNIRKSLAPGAPFPDFTETDIAGRPLSVSRYKGKVVLVDFWATWCMPCVMSLPEVLDAYGKYHQQGFDVIGISLDEERAALERFIKSRNVPWQQFNDGKSWESPLVARYGVEAIPSTYLLDRQGRIIGANLRGEALDAAIAKALKDSKAQAAAEAPRAN